MSFVQIVVVLFIMVRRGSFKVIKKIKGIIRNYLGSRKEQASRMRVAWANLVV